MARVRYTISWSEKLRTMNLSLSGALSLRLCKQLGMSFESGMLHLLICTAMRQYDKHMDNSSQEYCTFWSHVTGGLP